MTTIEPQPRSVPPHRLPRLSLRTATIKVAIASAAASLALMAGLWIQMANGKDPALASTSRPSSAAAQPAAPDPAVTVAPAPDPAASNPAVTASPAPVQTATS